MKKIILLSLALSMAVFADYSRDNETKVVTDNTTQLQWQDNERKELGFLSAIQYCENLTLGGYNDWQLPNITELDSIIDFTKSWPALDSTFKTVINKPLVTELCHIDKSYKPYRKYCRYTAEYKSIRKKQTYWSSTYVDSSLYTPNNYHNYRTVNFIAGISADSAATVNQHSDTSTKHSVRCVRAGK